ncbi:extracellular solute-binding protein [Paenibacillus sp. LMG 31461]|uniref:Extracellular solute-binding protein n=1 Tax=Paenibacillus plantarum TaxID=2654975 RepID=A0ABX1XAA6_9BACL|nr:extracellular solute-binding protein [Paenibacillus plantarum]NOU65321.1 extracellular solute-binding protein [Paenibacillus plantarum]
MKNNKVVKSWGLSLTMVLAISAILSGCTTSNSTSGTSSPSAGASSGPAASPATPTGPAKVSMLNVYFSNTAPKADGPVVKETERIANAKLDITYVPFNVYSEKLNVTMTSGEMPQSIMVENPFITSVINGIRSGMFWDLTPYLNEFPNLKKYDKNILNNLAVDGKYYVIPRPRPLVRIGTIIRKDWLDNVGLAEPKTIDEFYNVLKAFKEKDPDKNGVNDTYGLMLYENGIPADIFAWFGAPNNWMVDKNGNFIRDVETKEYREGLTFLRKLYNENLINKNFAIVVRNEARKDLYNNKVGISIESIDAVVPFYYLQMADTKNKYTMTVSPPINGKSYATTGHFGGALIPKTSVKTEKELREVLRYFNTENSDEAKAEFLRISQENDKKPAAEQFNVDDLKNLITTDAIVYPTGTTDTDVMLKKRMIELADASVQDPSMGLISPTQTEKDAQLKTLLSDARAQYIMGKIDDAGFDAVVQQWKKIGGDQVAKELSELYKKK